MVSNISASFDNGDVHIKQYKYPIRLSVKEAKTHDIVMIEYADEIYQAMIEASERARPNIDLYLSQPQITPDIRLKLVDFALKLLVRLKIIPFVFYQGIQLFDLYCLRRIVVLAHAQLAITTCLWIAAKTAGGNNHFANLNCEDVSSVFSISDLGHGSGARFHGPTERFRHPRLNELVKLCGSKCNYDSLMFVQMELHILTALEWNFNIPCISDFMIHSTELQVSIESIKTDESIVEMFRTKRFIAYTACYLFELVNYTPSQIATVLLDLVNDTLQINEGHPLHQKLSISEEGSVVDYNTYYHIRRHLERCVRNASAYLLEIFDTRGPQLLRSKLCSSENQVGNNSPLSLSNYSSGSIADSSIANYTYMGSDSMDQSLQNALPSPHDNVPFTHSQMYNKTRELTVPEHSHMVYNNLHPELSTFISGSKGQCDRYAELMLQTPQEDDYMVERDFPLYGRPSN